MPFCKSQHDRGIEVIPPCRFRPLHGGIYHLGPLASPGWGFSLVQRYDSTLPDWQKTSGDQHFISDINGDGKIDQFVYNDQDWSTQTLGRMISEDTTPAADWVADWVGKWNLESWIRLRLARREGASGKPDLLVDNHDWFGMISGGFSIGLQKMYDRWIPNYHSGRNW